MILTVILGSLQCLELCYNKFTVFSVTMIARGNKIEFKKKVTFVRVFQLNTKYRFRDILLRIV